MDTKAHWENVYETKSRDTVSWYAPHLDTSLNWICELADDPATANVIDIGAGEATLVDDLLERGFGGLSVLDISEKAIVDTQLRLGPLASQVTWYATDVLQAEFPEAKFEIWHDRAVFHFLTDEGQRLTYINQLRKALKPGGVVVLATFGSDGPLKCSGLPVCRYDAERVLREFGPTFRLIGERTEIHHTPFGTTQQFLYVKMECLKDK